MIVPAERVVAKEKLLASPWASLPARLRLLAIASAPATIRWLREALVADGATRVQISEAIGLAAGVQQLRDELFDAILVVHDPTKLDALELVTSLRAGGLEEPLVVLGPQPEEEILAQCYECGADAYLCISRTTIRALLWALARAVQRHQLVRENRRLRQFERHRIERDQDEAQHLLAQQRAIVDELLALREAAQSRGSNAIERPNATSTSDAAVAPLERSYRDLLRCYVMMGAGNLSSEMERFLELVVNSGLSARRILELHLRAVEELVQGLRSRSSRHVLNRADLLILEVVVRLAEWYQHGSDRQESLEAARRRALG